VRPASRFCARFAAASLGERAPLAAALRMKHPAPHTRTSDDRGPLDWMCACLRQQDALLAKRAQQATSCATRRAHVPRATGRGGSIEILAPEGYLAIRAWALAMRGGSHCAGTGGAPIIKHPWRSSRPWACRTGSSPTVDARKATRCRSWWRPGQSIRTRASS